MHTETKQIAPQIRIAEFDYRARAGRHTVQRINARAALEDTLEQA
jgi:hypothetical protein